MSHEIIDRIRARKNSLRKHGYTEDEIGQRKALTWVLKLFAEHEKSFTRKVLTEKVKKKKTIKLKRPTRANQRRELLLELNNSFGPMLLSGNWRYTL